MGPGDHVGGEIGDRLGPPVLLDQELVVGRAAPRTKENRAGGKFKGKERTRN